MDATSTVSAAKATDSMLLHFPLDVELSTSAATYTLKSTRIRRKNLFAGLSKKGRESSKMKGESASRRLSRWEKKKVSSAFALLSLE